MMQFGGVIDGEHDYGVGSLKKVILGLKRRNTGGKGSDVVVVVFCLVDHMWLFKWQNTELKGLMWVVVGFLFSNSVVAGNNHSVLMMLLRCSCMDYHYLL